MNPLIVPTAYLPPVSYVAGGMHSERIIIEAFETYQKQTPRNHCLIYGPNGLQKLTIPVIKVNGNHTFTKNIRIAYSQDWQKIHWRSIETAYNNSPFFLYYRDHFEPFFFKKYDFLLDFNTRLFEVILEIIRIPLQIEFTDHFENSSLPEEHFSFEPYTQVFGHRSGFIPNLSIIDLLFNLGPEAYDYLEKSSPQISQICTD